MKWLLFYKKETLYQYQGECRWSLCIIGEGQGVETRGSTGVQTLSLSTGGLQAVCDELSHLYGEF